MCNGNLMRRTKTLITLFTKMASLVECDKQNIIISERTYLFSFIYFLPDVNPCTSSVVLIVSVPLASSSFRNILPICWSCDAPTRPIQTSLSLTWKLEGEKYE